MASYQVTHIVPDGSDPGRRIDAIYGPVCGLVYEGNAIQLIQKGIASYYTLVGGMRAQVYVAQHAFGQPFLTTSADGYGPNNLCQLPRINP
jgi:hypothetical protein